MEKNEVMEIHLSSYESSDYFPSNNTTAFSCKTSPAILDSHGSAWEIALKDISFALQNEYDGIYIFDVEVDYVDGCMQQGVLTNVIARVHTTPIRNKLVIASLVDPKFHPMNVDRIERLDFRIRTVQRPGLRIARLPSTHITLLVRKRQ
jgi:hypothetical protein